MTQAADGGADKVIRQCLTCRHYSRSGKVFQAWGECTDPARPGGRGDRLVWEGYGCNHWEGKETTDGKA